MNGTLSCLDTSHVSQFQGVFGIKGSLFVYDTTHVSQFQGYTNYSPLFVKDSIHYFPITGYVVDNSTRLPSDSTFSQGAIIGLGDMTFNTVDWTYAHGHQNIDGTWVDGTFQHLWYDPQWIFYSTWSQDYDTSDWSLVGYKFREPVHKSVGQYYASMVVSETPGHYENRWTYLRDSSSYAKEVVQPFVSMSRGLDSMSDYPI